MKNSFRELGETKMMVNSLGFGGIPIQRVNKEEGIKVIEEAVKQGINFFDSARGYTCSEEYLGLVLPNYRDKVYIATKSMARTYEKMKADIDISLNNFNTTYIDLYQCHNLSKKTDFDILISDDGALKALLEAKEQGKIRHIGITSHSLDFINYLLDSDYIKYFETIQIPYNFLEQDAEKIFEKAMVKGIGTIAMKPFGGGVIDNKTVAIKFLMNNPNLNVLIPGMGSVDEVTQNVMTSLGDIKLNDQDLTYISDLKEEMKGEFCHRCGYCLPCTKGIDIPGIFTLENYFDRYGLKDWALSRYNNMSTKANACIECGLCMKKCPYSLNIPARLKRIHNKFTK